MQFGYTTSFPQDKSFSRPSYCRKSYGPSRQQRREWPAAARAANAEEAPNETSTDPENVNIACDAQNETEDLVTVGEELVVEEQL